jgi:hypothetical protein
LCCLFFLAIVLSVLLGHCVVCSSSIYGSWLPLWYLQTLLNTMWAICILHVYYGENKLHWDDAGDCVCCLLCNGKAPLPKIIGTVVGS